MNLANTGIYTIKEASNLSRVSEGKIRGWIKGYQQKDGGRTEPIIRSQIEPIDGRLAIGFLDLMELRFIHHFLEAGVKWSTLKKAAQNAREEFDLDHPFASKFVTDTFDIFKVTAEEAKDPVLLNLATKQYTFNEMLKQGLVEGLTYNENGLVRKWQPIKNIPNVVLDPNRSFGHPILDSCSIPTATIAKTVEIEGDPKIVAGIYEITVEEVNDALTYENNGVLA